jgi:predicted nucleic acid-binding Zn ribbon protein
MSWSSIDQVITDMTQAPAWDDYRAWQEVLTAWPQVLASLKIPHQSVDALAEQIYPRSRKGTILQVATSSAALADRCTWQSRQILKTLNTTLTQPITEIRFSSGHWQKVTATETIDRFDQNATRADCPQCAACTPQWELDRWSVCRFCISRDRA